MNTRKNRFLRTAAALAAATLLLTVAACSSDQPKDPSEPQLLRLAFGSEPDFTTIGTFKWIETLEADYNVEVKELYFQSSQDAFRAVVAGEADLSLASITSAIVLNMTAGEDVKVIVADLQAPDYILVTTPDIKTDEDLAGGRIGISTPGDISDTLTRVVLEDRGDDVSKIDFVQIGGTGARMQALLSNQISGGAAHAAEGLAAVGQGLNNLFAYGESIPDYLQHGVIAPQKWLDANPELAQTVVDTFIDSTRWAANNGAEYIAKSKDHVDGIEDDIRQEAYDIFTKIGMFAVNGGMDDDQLDSTVEIEKRVGTFGGSEPPANSDWADASYVEDYLARNGRQ